jgi:ribose transport system permease protein
MQSKSFLLIVLTLIVFAVVYIFEPGAYNTGNAAQLMATLSYTGVMLCGIAMLLMSGGFDFSTSAQASVAMLVFADLVRRFPSVPWPIFVLCALVFGVISGSINAFFANGLGLMPFICTIGMSSVWTGLAALYTRGSTIPIRNATFNSIAAKYVFGTPIPWTFVFALVLAFVYSTVVKYTRFGRSILMSGGNPTAARLAGLNPKRIQATLFINNGVLAALAGLIWASQQKMGSPTGLTTAAPDMSCLTASILGGVSFMGGSGALGGAFIGIILIQVLAYGLQVLGLPTWVITLINGSLLVIAISIDTFNMKRRMKKLGLKTGSTGRGMGMPGMR